MGTLLDGDTVLYCMVCVGKAGARYARRPVTAHYALPKQIDVRPRLEPRTFRCFRMAVKLWCLWHGSKSRFQIPESVHPLIFSQFGHHHFLREQILLAPPWFHPCHLLRSLGNLKKPAGTTYCTNTVHKTVAFSTIQAPRLSIYCIRTEHLV
jgi:hypothetical protein